MMFEFGLTSGAIDIIQIFCLISHFGLVFRDIGGKEISFFLKKK
jgi:hypothetical protein